MWALIHPKKEPAEGTVKISGDDSDIIEYAEVLFEMSAGSIRGTVSIDDFKAILEEVIQCYNLEAGVIDVIIGGICLICLQNGYKKLTWKEVRVFLASVCNNLSVHSRYFVT